MKLLTGQAPRYKKGRPGDNSGAGRSYSNKFSCCVCNWRNSLAHSLFIIKRSNLICFTKANNEAFVSRNINNDFG